MTAQTCEVLPNTQRPCLRPVRPADALGIQDFIRRLSAATRRARFFAPIRELAPAARAAGIERAVVDVLCGNDAMLALARRYAFAAARSPYDSTMHRLELDLRGAALAAA